MTLDYERPYPRIPSTGLRGRDGHAYVPDERLLAAANAALAVQMPLLLTGEAGCGKTDFAWAAAGALAPDDGDPQPLECYVRSDSRAKDLLYSYDAIRRFGDAQHGGDEGRRRAEDARNYVHLQPLGIALMSETLRVVLIDEIDKAPRDLPNDLLRELDQGHFEIPEIPVATARPSAGSKVEVGRPDTYRNTMKRPKPDVRPFVIITSNVERQLPDPFLRRCVFFHIPFPDTDGLRRILESHLRDGDAAGGSPLPPNLLAGALDVFTRLRKMPALTKKPATSELISWVKALAAVHGADRARTAIEPFRSGGGDWSSLPGLGCLIKLREDLDRLTPRA
jgi:MoxR-like ATPase